jgi:hypothetical protein
MGDFHRVYRAIDFLEPPLGRFAENCDETGSHTPDLTEKKLEAIGLMFARTLVSTT